MAAQLSLENGPERRRLRSWTARASNSLPVPVSPSMMTVLSVGLTISTCSSTRRSAGLVPTILDVMESMVGKVERHSPRPRHDIVVFFPATIVLSAVPATGKADLAAPEQSSIEG